MDKNRIEGRRGAASWHNTAKPAGLPVKVNAEAVQGSNAFLHGFLPNRSAHQAVRQMEACWKEGRTHAVDCDLKSFFDTVNHDRLMEQLRGKVRDPLVLGLIRRYLQAGVVLPDGTREATPRGVPQGGPLAPAGQYRARPA